MAVAKKPQVTRGLYSMICALRPETQVTVKNVFTGKIMVSGPAGALIDEECRPKTICNLVEVCDVRTNQDGSYMEIEVDPA